MALHYGAILRQALLLEMLRRDAEKRKAADPLQRLAAFLDHDEFSGEKQLTAISEAFSDGRFTGVVLMDRLEERLRDLISFLNDSSRFQLIAVELNYYLHEGAEIVSPRLFGAEARHSQASSSEARGRWDETSSSLAWRNVLLRRWPQRAGSSISPAHSGLWFGVWKREPFLQCLHHSRTPARTLNHPDRW